MKIKMEKGFKRHNHGVVGMLEPGKTYDVPDYVGKQLTDDFPEKFTEIKKAMTSPKDKAIHRSPRDKSMFGRTKTKKK